MAETRRLRGLETEAFQELDIPEGPLVVALSGGADSAALAYLCGRLGREVTSLHVDHGLTHSERLRTAAQNIADALGIEMKTIRIDVPDGPSPEGQARTARYEVLCGQDASVLTAHTMNDVVETMLINLIRGTGPDGLTGIPLHRQPNIYRPILGITRSETREIASLAGLAFVDDPSNQDRSILRNHVRLDLIPLFEAANPKFVESMATTARLLGADREMIEDLSRPHLQKEGAPVGVLTALPRPVADRVVRRLLTRAGVEPDASSMERAWSVITGETARQELKGGLVAVVDRGVIRVERAI